MTYFSQMNFQFSLHPQDQSPMKRKGGEDDNQDTSINEVNVTKAKRKKKSNSKASRSKKASPSAPQPKTLNRVTDDHDGHQTS